MEAILALIPIALTALIIAKRKKLSPYGSFWPLMLLGIVASIPSVILLFQGLLIVIGDCEISFAGQTYCERINFPKPLYGSFILVALATVFTNILFAIAGIAFLIERGIRRAQEKQASNKPPL